MLCLSTSTSNKHPALLVQIFIKFCAYHKAEEAGTGPVFEAKVRFLFCSPPAEAPSPGVKVPGTGQVGTHLSGRIGQ